MSGAYFSDWDFDVIFLTIEEDAPIGDVQDRETEREERARDPIHGNGPAAPQLLQIERSLRVAVETRPARWR